jgi:hypothetical protein
LHLRILQRGFLLLSVRINEPLLAWPGYRGFGFLLDKTGSFYLFVAVLISPPIRPFLSTKVDFGSSRRSLLIPSKLLLLLTVIAIRTILLGGEKRKNRS